MLCLGLFRDSYFHSTVVEHSKRMHTPQIKACAMCLGLRLRLQWERTSLDLTSVSEITSYIIENRDFNQFNINFNINQFNEQYSPHIETT